jgi:hypothetical protein
VASRRISGKSSVSVEVGRWSKTQRWLQQHLPRLPGWSDLAKAMRYALAHWDGLILYLDDGRLEMDTNIVERAIRQ